MLSSQKHACQNIRRDDKKKRTNAHVPSDMAHLNRRAWKKTKEFPWKFGKPRHGFVFFFLFSVYDPAPIYLLYFRAEAVYRCARIGARVDLCVWCREYNIYNSGCIRVTRVWYILLMEFIPLWSALFSVGSFSLQGFTEFSGLFHRRVSCNGIIGPCRQGHISLYAIIIIHKLLSFADFACVL